MKGAKNERHDLQTNRNFEGDPTVARTNSDSGSRYYTAGPGGSPVDRTEVCEREVCISEEVQKVIAKDGGQTVPFLLLFFRVKNRPFNERGLNAMDTMLFKPIFTTSKKIPILMKELMTKEYVRLRNEAVEALNPNFEKWNSEYTGPEADEDDELKEYGGTEYCEYIRSKMRPVLKRINDSHRSSIIIIDTDEVGDLVAKSKIGDVTMTVRLIPVKGWG